MAGGLIIPGGAMCFCVWCKIFFPSWSRFNTHRQNAHRGKKLRRSRSCPHCWKAFRHARSLNQHVATGCHAFPYPVKKMEVETDDGDQQIVDVLMLPEYEDSNKLEHGVLHKY